VDSLLLALRLVHIVLGTLWVGMMVFTSFFLTPAARDAGPAGGKIMLALQRRGLMNVIPLTALGTLVSGIWLVQRVWGGMAALTASRVGLTFTIGGVAALIAFVLGITLVRPAMKRASALAEVVESARTDEERAAPAAEAQRLRARGATAGRVATWLLLLAVAAMAVARYV
jgi:uncharacterized membrane protein